MFRIQKYAELFFYFEVFDMKCNQLFRKIDELDEMYRNLWEDICNIESPSDSKTGVDAVGQYITAFAERHGWKTERCPQAVSGDAICITMNPEAKGKPVALSAHMEG